MEEEVKAVRSRRHWVAPPSSKRLGLWLAASSLFAVVMFSEEINDMRVSITQQYSGSGKGSGESKSKGV